MPRIHAGKKVYPKRSRENRARARLIRYAPYIAAFLIPVIVMVLERAGLSLNK